MTRRDARTRAPLRRALAGSAFAVLVLAVGCGDGDTDEGGAGGADEGGAATSVAAGTGAAAFAQNCSACHGADLRGTDRGPSLLSEVYEPGHHSDESFRRAISQGSPAHHWDFGDMPPVPALDDDTVTAIIAHVRDQQHRHGFEPYPPG